MHDQGGHTLLSALQSSFEQGGEASWIPDLGVHTGVVVNDEVQDGDEACSDRNNMFMSWE